MIDSPDTINEFSPLARHFADFMVHLNGSDSPDLHMAARLLSEAVSQGHICLKLNAIDEYRNQFIYAKQLIPPGVTIGETALNDTAVVGRPGEFKPLILDDKERLYTYRYWQYEQNVASHLQDMIRVTYDLPPSLKPDNCHEIIRRLFPKAVSESHHTAGPAIAAFMALTRNFCLISGSPGTGKTTAVVRILAFLLEATGNPELRIALAAPTAKAAVRLQEAMTKAKGGLLTADSLKSLIPDKAFTIHRLLESKGNLSRYAFDKDNPLPFEVIVLDEASMIDLPLMSHLLDAIHSKARLIMLGDPFQLSSVDAGTVLGDICNAAISNRYSEQFTTALCDYTGVVSASCTGENCSGVQDSMVTLTRNYRYPEDSALGHLQRAVIAGDTADALSVLTSGAENLEWVALTGDNDLMLFLRQKLGKYLNNYIDGVNKYADNLNNLFTFYESFRVLTAARGGLFGTVRLNLLIEKYLKDLLGLPPERLSYSGKVVMVTKNDYHLQLFNGDIGLFHSGKSDVDQLSVFFRDSNGGTRKFSPYTLPEHETAFALTVHKSQGSEFDHVFLFLPDIDSPVLCRELLYTGITRARKSLTICGSREIISAAISRKLVRYSGLTEKLSARL